MDAEIDGNGHSNLGAPTTRQDLERGLQFANVMASVNQDQSNEAIAYVQALTDLLAKKGLISEAELEAPLERARLEVAQVMMPRVRVADTGDKYATGQAVEIDCASLIPLCQARCCTFKLFLTKQDVDEGVARWDYGNPYWLRQDAPGGYCVHSDPATKACTIHAHRPHVCRQYDCRNDLRVWLDFEARVPAPMPKHSGDAPVSMAEVAFHNALRVANGERAAEFGSAADQ